jgi:hypothetical protein
MEDLLSDFRSSLPLLAADTADDATGIVMAHAVFGLVGGAVLVALVRSGRHGRPHPAQAIEVDEPDRLVGSRA